MVDLGKDVVAPVLLVSGMVIGVKTMDKVSRMGEKKSSRGTHKKPTKRKTRKTKSPPANSYYCRKCKVRHLNSSKIGKLHKRGKVHKR